MAKDRVKLVAQTCTSRDCKKKFKNEITKISQTITTPQIINWTKRTVQCLYCQKISKLKK